MYITEQLKKHGCRITKPRQEILKVLADYPLTVHEIFTKLQVKRISVDLASVYRSLDLFVNIGVVNSIELGEDRKRYELVDSQRHHHHLVCTTCKSIEDITMDESSLLQCVKSQSEFKVATHRLEFFGTCKSCQKLKQTI